MDEMNWNLPPELKDALKRHYAAPEPVPAFTAKLDEALSRRQAELLRPQRKTLMQRRPILVLVLTLLALLLLTGVVYAVGNWLKYIYVPQANTFLPIENTLVIQQPVRQEHDGQRVTVTQGTASAAETIVWLEFSETARPLDQAVLKTPDGTEIKLNGWEYTTSEAGPHGIRARFAALPAGVTVTTLALPEGWQIPLTWISLSAAQTPAGDVSSVPSPNPIAAPTTETPCVTAHETQLCVLGNAQADGKTIILVEARSQSGQLTAGGQPGQIIWSDETTPITLVDALGNSLPFESMNPAQAVDLSGKAAMELTFTGTLAAGQIAKLTIPGLYVSQVLQQSVTVDLGDDPQPGPLPVSADVEAFGQTIRFRKGHMDGDGTNSLRLYLDSEPVSIQDGIEPHTLELGRPDRVDDLFGSGDLTGGKDLFVELFQYGKKLTGKLTLPIIRASGIVHGPFTFNVSMAAPPSATATPIAANPDNFSPAPTATPLPLERYHYTGEPLNPGDLLYTALDDDKTQVYAFTPGPDAHPRHIATLPGGVSQIFPHADRLGLDYLAGESVTKDGFSFFDALRLYSIRFDAPAPRLLYSFAPNSQNTIGTTVTGNESFDGRYIIFSTQATTQTVESISSSTKQIWFDLACRTNARCISHDLVVPALTNIDSVRFAPNENKILFTASKDPDAGSTHLFIQDFDPQKPDSPAVNISQDLSIAELAQPAAWTSDDKIFTICGDSIYSETSAFCIVDPANQSSRTSKPFNPNLNGYRLFGDYQLAPSGKQVAAITILIKATRNTIPELRLLDLDGHPGAVVAQSKSLIDGFEIAFSPSSQYLGYMFENGQKLEIFDTASDTHILVDNSTQSGTISWIGWVK